LNRHGIDGAYLPLPVAPEHFAEVVQSLANAGFAGVNVTIPHKEAAFTVCNRVTDFAQRAGAVNTLVFRNGITGDNTDGYGFIENLRAHGVNPAAGPALILGAGGAARAIAAALQDEGAGVILCNRTRERAEALAAKLPAAQHIPWEHRSQALSNVALVVNTTALGMAGHAPLNLSFRFAAAGLTAADIVYTPLQTHFLKEAKAAGLRTVEGLGMLLHQAVPGFESWFGIRPVVDDELYRIVAA
jgi:shikimate dehydrogenase